MDFIVKALSQNSIDQIFNSLRFYLTENKDEVGAPIKEKKYLQINSGNVIERKGDRSPAFMIYFDINQQIDRKYNYATIEYTNTQIELTAWYSTTNITTGKTFTNGE